MISNNGIPTYNVSMIHFFVGTKAQLIKIAPIMRELTERNIDYNFVFSGQHQETIRDLLNIFEIRAPDTILYSGKDITGIIQMMIWAKNILKYYGNDKSIWKGDSQGIVLNHGDTFSTLLGALLARKNKLNIGHIESGLRSYNFFHPFPEELIRLAVFRLSHRLYCPNDWAMKNVASHKGEAFNTNGNTLIDTLRLALAKQNEIRVDMPKEKFAIISIHRFENIFSKKRFSKILDIIESVSEKIPLLFILHKPTKVKLISYNLMPTLESNNRIELRPRYEYFSFIKLLLASEFLITDGGSNQEECFYLDKPCILMRNRTERTEGLQSNVFISNYNHQNILDYIEKLPHKKFSTTLKSHASPTKLIIEDLISHGFAQPPG